MIGQTNIGLTYKPSDKSSTGTMVLRSSNIVNGKIDLTDLVRVDCPIRENQYAQDSDILICARNGSKALVGKCAIISDIGERASFGAFMAIYRTPYYRYVYCYLNSGLFREVFDDGNSTAINQLTQDMIKKARIPFPPLAEQIRIAEAVDKLLALTSEITEQVIECSQLIQKAKSRILDLAIRGKLVPQNPDDEPASVLLDRIRAEKEELIKQGKIKQDKRESVIFRGEDNSYYLRTGDLIESLSDWGFDDLPDNWEICCLGEVCDYGDCENVEASEIEESEWILDLEDIEKDTGKILTRITKAERESTSTKHRFYKGQVLYSKLRPYLNKVVLADQDGYCTSEILPLEFNSIILPEYARYYMMSPTFLRYANRCSYGVKMPRLGTEDGKKAIVPVPPAREQAKITARIKSTFQFLDNIASSLK